MNNIAITRRSSRNDHSSNYQLEQIAAHTEITEVVPIDDCARGPQVKLNKAIVDLKQRYGRNFTIYFSDISRFTRNGEIPPETYQSLRDRDIDVIAINTKESGNLLSLMNPENKAMVERELKLAKENNYLRSHQTTAAKKATKKPDLTVDEVIIKMFEEKESRNKIGKILKQPDRYVSKVIKNYEAELAAAERLQIIEDEVELVIDLDLDYDDDFDLDIFGDNDDTQESDFWMFNESDALIRRDKIREERDAHKQAVSAALKVCSLF